MKILLQDTVSHRRAVDEISNKAQTLVVTVGFSREISSAKTKYENLLAETQVTDKWKMSRQQQ